MFTTQAMRTIMNREVSIEEWERRAGIGRRLLAFRRHICGNAPISGDLAQNTLFGPLLIQHHTWRQWETGTRIPGDVVLKLIVGFNVSPEWLLLDEGPMFRGATESAQSEIPKPERKMDEGA
jgi:hypothetical protein